MNTKIDVLGVDGSIVDNINLPIDLSLLKANEITIYRVVNALIHNANRVRFSHYKNVSGLTGSNRKIRPQKRTGKSRQGCSREIHMRGGAVKFGFTGDKNIDFARRFRSYKNINKKESRLAILQLIANRFQNKALFVVDSLSTVVKTKDADLHLNKITVSNPIIFYSTGNISKAYQNIKNVKLSNIDSINAYKIVSKPELIFDYQSIKKFFKI